MSEKTPEKNASTTAEDARGEEAYVVRPELVQEIHHALATANIRRVEERVGALHHADLADLIEMLAPEDRKILIEIIRAEFDPETLATLEEHVREEVIEQLGAADVAAAIRELDTDDAVEVVEHLDDSVQQEVLDAVPAGDRALLEEGLTYPEDSAGRLMQRQLVAIPAYWTVGETIDFMRQAAERDDDELPEEFYDIFVVDPRHQPLGTVPLARLLRTKRPVKVSDLMAAEIRPVPVTMDQEQVAFLFRQYDLASAPVVSEDGRLVGVITHDDVLDVIDEEAEEDLMRLGGVTGNDLYRAAIDTSRSRFPWLVVNLATAIVASIVIGLFEATIQQIVALAVLMPIVASMGGNAGTQTLTVAVRALAMNELTASNALRIVGKEVLVGGFNGLIFAVLMGIVAWLWFGSPEIGIVIAAAMAINLLVAGFAGVAIPVGLDRTGIDPAVASVVLLTTITDVVGFATFLGLAALFLL
ncbi:MAG: magnesium transporter [Proteobacteria bacterium]|nr:magnesium transporter [Pseudomonadota bacterium]